MWVYDSMGAIRGGYLEFMALKLVVDCSVGSRSQLVMTLCPISVSISYKS